ncbi:hypothetical protein [Benzoatithermus flavus]|uniref:Uncharacterized protein n=1 Tax=Benzoatithermus flavus TaxID=3108223 RepID=A0ABU8XNT4_9PROT
MAKKAYRTYWIIRQRYRRIGLWGSIVGGLATGALLTPYVQSADWSTPGEATTLLQQVGIFVMAVLLPPVLARLFWRIHRRRYFDDIYQITHR